MARPARPVRALAALAGTLVVLTACGRGPDVDRPAGGGGLEGDTIAPPTTDSPDTGATAEPEAAEPTGQPTRVPELSLSDFDTGSPAAGAEGVFTAGPGQCLRQARPGARISCEEAHRAEVFYTFNLDPGDWPGDDVVRSRAQGGCGSQVVAYLGGEDDGTYEVQALTPSESTWEESDTEVLCLLVTGAETTGSAFRSLE